ncbi:MAG: hypothetical protein ACE5R6_21225 [Candidatus Heimdallarchaeota archaeon]
MRIHFSLHDISYRKAFFLLFVSGFIVRLIPEVLTYPYPIGADIFHYAERMSSGVVWYHWSQVFSTRWLFYAMLILLYKIMSVDPFLLLKLVAPTLYALNVCGVYYFARKTLNWETKKALTAAFFFMFQLASLRISWDHYRNMFGLAILLFTLPSIRNMEKRRDLVSFVLLSMLVVFAHEFPSVIMFTVILIAVMSDFLKGKRVRALKVLATTSPALAMFLTSVYLMIFPIPFHMETNVIVAHDVLVPKPGGLFFLIDYLNVVHPDNYYLTYLSLVSDVLSRFGLLYLLCLPFVFVGFLRDRILNGWTLLTLVGTFDSLITPFCALDFWNRWILMLVYPFTFYTVNGIHKVSESNRRWLGWMKVSKRTMFGILLLMVVLQPPISLVTKYYNVVQPFSQSGASRIMKLHSTLPLQDVEGTIQVIGWLNSHMREGSCVLVHEYFFRWASLRLDKRYTIIRYFRDVEGALTLALEHHFDPIYLIWWNENVEWSYGTKSYFDITVPKHFETVFSSGRVSVFEYHSSFHA